MASTLLPDLDELRAALAPLCAEAGFSTHPLISVRREANDRASTFESEIVNCEFADGTRRRLFLKYTALIEDGEDPGETGGPAYEALVYSGLLCGANRPAFYGLQSGRGGTQWLVLEFMERAVLLRHAEDDAVFLKAAAWLGRFHAAQEQRIALARPDGVRVHDVEFFRGWAMRINALAEDWHRCAPWLAGVGAGFGGISEVLLASPRTLVHGDLYPQNLLSRDGDFFLVDWEAAAIGPGEIDLVTFSEDWPEEDERQFQREYRAARWPAGAPGLFERRLAAAYVFTHLRWVCEHPASAPDGEEAQWRLGELQRWAGRFAAA